MNPPSQSFEFKLSHGSVGATAASVYYPAKESSTVVKFLQIQSASPPHPLRNGENKRLVAARRILIVDDDPELRETVTILLEREGFIPIEASEGRSGLHKALTLKPDLILVDLRLPILSGIDLCKQVRANSMSTPMIVLSAIGDEIDKVLLLEVGADDYVVKPFGSRELLARVKALLRRTSVSATRVLAFGDVQIDLERRVVSRDGKEIRPTPAEYNLLLFFLQNPDRVLTRDLILNSVWGYEFYPNTRTVDAHVVKLRQKFEVEPSTPKHFITVHGVGYRFLP